MARPAWKTATESWPRQGNRELPLTLDFTNTGVIVDDLSPEMQASSIETIQAIYVDNSANPSAFSITFQPGGHNVNVQPYNQGIFPVIAWGMISYRAVTTAGQKINVIFSNTRKDFFAWGPVPGVTITPALASPAVNFQPLAVGDNVIVPGVALQTIKAYRLLLSFGAGTNVQFFDGPSAANRPLTGIINMFAGGSIMLQATGVPWLTTTAGNSLVMTSSAAANMGGMVGYVQS